MSFPDGNLYAVDGGLIILIGAATVEQTGMIGSQVYQFTASDPCLCRWGADDASIADGGFDFAIGAGETMEAVCPPLDTAINVIELSSGSATAATLAISRIIPR